MKHVDHIELTWRILAHQQEGFHLADEAREFLDAFDERADLK